MDMEFHPESEAMISSLRENSLFISLVRQHRGKCTHFLVLSSPDMPSVLCGNEDISEILKVLNTRHSSVVEVSRNSSEKSQRSNIPTHVKKMSEEQNGKELSHFIKHGDVLLHVIGFQTSADIESVFKEIGVDISTVTAFEILGTTVNEVSEDDVITSLLKQAARRITLQHTARKIHSAIPYHYEDQTAVVIYTYDISPDICEKDWCQEFLDFPVLIIDLMSSYEADPPVIPVPYPVITKEKYMTYSETKDEVTPELAKKHSNLSTICIDYRLRKSKFEDDEICIQIGVLTKGMVPLGEELFPSRIKGIPVDVVESSADLCVSSTPMLRRVEPLKLGVGIGVEGDNERTGSLGAVVKHRESGEIFLLSCAHVLRGPVKTSITQPSLQDYKQLEKELKYAHRMYSKNCEALRNNIEQRRNRCANVHNLEIQLKKHQRNLNRTKGDLQHLEAEESPRKVGTLISQIDYSVHHYRSDEKSYGIDAAVAEIESDEFNAEDIWTMYEWPDDLRDGTGGTVDEIKLNGKFMSKEEVQLALLNKTVVFKCGRTTGVTKGIMYKEENVRIPGNRGPDFVSVPDNSEEVRGACAVSYGTPTQSKDDDMWYNVLHVISTTERTTGERNFCAAGDSGAVVFDKNGTCVGLLFSRLDTQFPLAGGLVTPMYIVLDALNIAFACPDDLMSLDVKKGKQ